MTHNKLGFLIMALNRSELKQLFSIDPGALMFKKWIQMIESNTLSVFIYRF